MRKSLFAIIATLALTLAAHADTLNVNGAFVSGTTLTGTLTLDTTTHLFSTANLTAAGVNYTATFTNPPTSQGPGNGDFALVLVSQIQNQTATLDLFLPATSLTGYTGSPLCSTALFCGAAPDASSINVNFGLFSISEALASGTVGSSTVTPEPSTLALLGTGLLGAVTTLRRKLVHP